MNTNLVRIYYFYYVMLRQNHWFKIVCRIEKKVENYWSRWKKKMDSRNKTIMAKNKQKFRHNNIHPMK